MSMDPSYPNSSPTLRRVEPPSAMPKAITKLQLEEQYPLLTDQSVESLVLPSTIRRDENLYVTSPKFYSRDLRFAQVPLREGDSPRNKVGKELSRKSTSRVLLRPHYEKDLLSRSQQTHAGYYVTSPKNNNKKDTRSFIFSKRSTQGRANLVLDTSTDSFLMNSTSRQTPQTMKHVNLLKSHSPKGTLDNTDRPVNLTAGAAEESIIVKPVKKTEKDDYIRKLKQKLSQFYPEEAKHTLNLEAKANLKLFMKVKGVVHEKVCAKLRKNQYFGEVPISFDSGYTLADRQRVADGAKYKRRRVKINPYNPEIGIFNSLNQTSDSISFKRQSSQHAFPHHDRQERRSKQKEFADDVLKVNNIKAVCKGVVKAGEYFGAQEWIQPVRENKKKLKGEN